MKPSLIIKLLPVPHDIIFQPATSLSPQNRLIDKENSFFSSNTKNSGADVKRQ